MLLRPSPKLDLPLPNNRLPLNKQLEVVLCPVLEELWLQVQLLELEWLLDPLLLDPTPLLSLKVLQCAEHNPIETSAT